MDATGRFGFVELEESERDLFDFYRAHGAARQVAAELCALAKRGALDVIAALYKDGDGGYGDGGLGLDCWNVSLEFEGYEAEVKGVWGLNYAQSDAAQKVALQVS